MSVRDKGRSLPKKRKSGPRQEAAPSTSTTARSNRSGKAGQGRPSQAQLRAAAALFAPRVPK
jgi:hypothetical protein